jgi:hypothetical protein
VPLTKLVELDGDVRPYLAALIIAALHKAGDALVVPDQMTIRKVTEQEFENLLVSEAGKAYDNYGIIGRDLVQATAP